MSREERFVSFVCSSRLQEIVRYAIVGLVATGLHYGIYMVLLRTFCIEAEDTFYTNIAYTLGYIVAWFCNFYLSAHFTFRSNTSVKRGIGFALSHAINYGLHLLLLNMFLWLGMSEVWAPIPVFGIVIPVNYLLVRYVFKSNKFR